MADNILDRAIGAVAPRWQLRRMQARLALAGLTRATAHYDGAQRNHRTAGRRVGSTSANAETLLSLHRLRDMSRELVRNNAYAARAVGVIAANVVGPGITPDFSGPNKRQADKLQPLVAAHLESPAIDFDGRHDLYGLQNLIMRTVVESGEALVVRYRPPASLKLPVPLQVRVLEPDYLCPYKDTMLNEAGHTIIQGIEFDSLGRRVAYHLFAEHPGNIYLLHNLKTVRVPAEDVIHVFRADRPGQARGVPWGAPVVMTTLDLADYEDAELMRQKIAACFAVFWIDSEGRTKLAENSDAGTSQTGLGTDMLEPGMQQRLPPGVDVKFASPPLTQGFEAYQRAGLRKIATGYGLPYEFLASDLSQVNFSSGRMGWLEFQRSIIQWQWHMLIPHACQGIGRWFLEAAEFRLPGASDFTAKWTEPRREMIDPTKEIPAIRDAIRAGLTSRTDAIRQAGRNPEDVEREITAENKRADKDGNKFDSDGRFPVGAPMNPTSTDAKLPGDPKNG